MPVKLTPQKKKNLKRLVNQLFFIRISLISFLAKANGTTVSVLQQLNILPCITEH